MCGRTDVTGGMTKAHDFQVVNVSGFKVRRNQVSATLDVVAPFKWSGEGLNDFAWLTANECAQIYSYRIQT